MKFFCDQRELIRKLNIVSKAVSTRTTIPSLKGILFDLKSNELVLSASDLDMTIKTSLEVKGEENGKVVIPAKLALEIVRKYPAEELEIIEKDNNINIKCRNSNASVVGMDASDYPVISTDEASGKPIVINKNDLNNMIRKTSFAASIDQTKGILTGVLSEFNKDNITMVAIDGFRMAITKENIKNEKEERMIISARILNEIIKITSEEEEEGVEIYNSGKNVVIKNDNTIVSIRTLAGEFVKYEDIIPKENTIQVRVRRNEIMDAVERASILTDIKNNLIRVKIRENVMTITSSSEEGGAVEDVLITKTGNDIEIGFNARYLIDALKNIDDEEIVMEMNSPITPCLITPIDGEKYTYIVLPVRLSNAS